MTKFAYCDTKRPDGVYVTFERVEEHDGWGIDPQRKDEGISRKRVLSFNRGEWWFIGVRAKAVIEVVTSGTQTTYTLMSPGLWGIESDSDESYLASVFEDECEILRNDLALIGAHFKPKEVRWFVVEFSGMVNENANSDSYPSFMAADKAMKSAYTMDEIDSWPIKIAVDRGDGNLSYDY